ncbi:LOW QUALITY PROTEIN: contactin-associated protein-like 5 [Callorhinchus milii]|uniref:LOW QUALITY PROTEIN: contactin-associated protein-like 5 n=1 Tax=Callorhinchus milii TaxID=7868 RepID=UPI001C3FBFEA|nr:LOW QUALITY PROTEIN: contactin-associated protein-like 5 [Callorhinchus milii]
MDPVSSISPSPSLPLSITLWMCLVTAYSHNCDNLLLPDLPQTSFRSSSELSGSHSPAFAKLNRRDGAGGWSPLESNRPQWLQIDLGERTEITAVATQGRYGSSDWVTSYALMFSDSESNWKQYRHQDSIWIAGQGQFGISCEELGSLRKEMAKIGDGRQKSAGGWSPLESNRPQWLQIDLGERTEITAVATQGRYGSSDWVTSYALMFSDSESNWKQYRHQDSIWAFSGNSNADTVAHHKLQYSIRARYIRFAPLQWNPNGRIGMRVEVYGCSYKSDVADFDGRSSLLYRFNQKTVSTVKDMISLQFRSTESEGVILHGEGQRGDYITLELSKGKVSLQLNLGDTKLQSVNGHTSATLGSLLDDQHWHSVTIERYNKQVNFTVDQHTQHFRTRGEFDYLDIDYELSFGGIPVPGKSVTFLRKNFRGCLENLYYNGVNIIDLAKRHKPQIHVLGNVSFSCWEAPVVPVTFGSSGSYLVLPGRPRMDGLSLSFQFRTWNGDGLLLYSRLPGTAGALRVRISNGKLRSNIRKSSRSQADITAGADLNDGQWHSVRLNARRNRVSVILDNNGTSTFHSTTQTPIFSGSSYYFGGCPENASSADCSNGFGNFEGCMRLILIDNQPVDLNLAGQGSQANFTDLHIDVCGILDRCLPNYCEHGGECSQSWSTFYCDCTGTGYTGETCHRSLYEKSCEAYRHKGSPSDFFSVDPDGSGPLGPLLVYCNMTEDKTWTVVQHNNTELTRVQGSSAGKPQLVHFSYTANMEQLRALIDSMDHCEQNVAYHCRRSRLLSTPGDTPLTWWIGRTNEKQTYWGGATPGSQECGCGLDGSCLDPQRGCNCDADRDQW